MKKLIALLLCLVMIVGLFASCITSGSEGTKGTEGTKAPEGTKGTDGKDETTAAPGYDFPESITDGVELGKLPLVPEGTAVADRTLNIGIPQHVYTDDYEENLLTIWFEEKTGVELDFTLFANAKGDYTSELNAKIAAGNKLPDILWGMSPGKDLISQWGNDDYLIDLMPYVEENSYWLPLAFEGTVAKGVSEEDVQFYYINYGKDPTSGEFYGMPMGSIWSNSIDNAIHLGINQAWLDNLKLAYPKTVDDLYNVLVAFRDKDPNGNGLKDEIPMIFNGGQLYKSDATEYLINAFVFCNDSVFFNVTDGKIWVPYTTDEYREAMKYMSKLYKEGLLSPSSWSTDQAGLKGMLAPEDGKNIIGVFGGHTTQVWDVAYESLMEYQPLAPMADKTGKGGYGPWDPVTSSFAVHISSDCKDPVLAFRFLDFAMYDPDAYQIQGRGPRVGTDWLDLTGQGYTDAKGNPANFRVVDDIRVKLNNYVWKGGVKGITFGKWVAAATNEGKSEVEIHKSTYYNKLGDLYKAAGLPAETVKAMAYNAEEQETYNEYYSMISDAVQVWRAEFISGARDPSSDADWKAYLDDLKSEGLDDLLAAAQSCYTRMMG